MAAQRDEDRSGREHGRTLITACGVLLAGASLAALVLTDQVKQLRLAVVGALWAFLLVSITGRFRSKAQDAGGESDDELRRFYQMELQQEVAARREYELRLEVQMRRELEESRTAEIEKLRAEVHRLRAELMGIEAPDRPALLAQANGMSPDRMQALHEEAQRVNAHRPVERLQLPAGFSDSPPPVDAAPSYSGTPPYDAEGSHPRLSTPEAYPEPYQSTEYIPAASHGSAANLVPPDFGPPPAPAMGAPVAMGAAAEADLTAGHGPAETSGRYPASQAHTNPETSEEFTVVTPYGTPESSGTFSSPVPSPAWSSYASPPNPGPAPESNGSVAPAPGYGTPGHGTPGYDGAGSAPSYPRPEPDTAYPTYLPTGQPDAAVETYPVGRHGARQEATPTDAPRANPFDPSNTWPGAFKVSREERAPGGPPPSPGQHADQRPAQQAGWRPTEQPAEWRPAESAPAPRGRHHAGDDPADERERDPASRPTDDVLAQILGRW